MVKWQFIIRCSMVIQQVDLCRGDAEHTVVMELTEEGWSCDEDEKRGEMNHEFKNPPLH